MLDRVRYALPHLVMLAVAGGLYAAALQIDTSGAGGRLGPDFWPKLVIALMALLSLYEASRRLLVGRPRVVEGDSQKAPAGAAEPEPAPAEPERTHHGMLWGGLVLVVGYVAAVPWLGFFVTTGLFLAGFAWVGGFRRPLLNLAVGGAGALLLVVLFMRVAYISLPLGEGVFRDLSVALLALLGVK